MFSFFKKALVTTELITAEIIYNVCLMRLQMMT